jgi:NAD-reducing hydrogenase small subunit
VHVLREFRARCKSWWRSAPAPSPAACRRSATRWTSAPSCRRSTATGPAWPPAAACPNDPELPLPLAQVHPIHEVVHVDHFLPGCPPSADAIWAFLTALLDGRPPALSPGMIQYD